MLLAAPAGTAIGPDLVITADDVHGQPSLYFDIPGGQADAAIDPIRLTESSVRDVQVRAFVIDPVTGKTIRAPYPTAEMQSLTGMANRLRLSVDPADAVGKVIALTQVSTNTTIGATHAVTNKPGQYDLPLTLAETGTFPQPATLRFSIQALADTTGFRMPRVTLRLLELDKGTSGIVRSGPPLVIEVLSDEAVPTVSFSPTDISIKEGGRTTTALVAEGAHGAEVNRVQLAVDGNALVDLYQGATKLTPVDGTITVNLKDTNVARLTARSTSDRSLLDGQMKKKTWRITDADGANVDPDANRYTVTVEGSTAVPALPLPAVALLAALLAAARLYRRRRG